MSDDIKFAEGFIFKRDPEAPEWKICNVSVKVDEAVAFLQENAVDGWVNLDVLRAKESGKVYGKVDTWTPNQGTAAKDGIAQAKQAAAPGGDFNEDIPFSNYEYRTFA